jgi:hypothetical protein
MYEGCGIWKHCNDESSNSLLVNSQVGWNEEASLREFEKLTNISALKLNFFEKNLHDFSFSLRILRNIEET